MPQIKATARWIENVRTIVDNSRTHTVVCDLPQKKGGDDTGPTALELAVMSIADCAAMTFADVCKKSGIKITSLEVVAEAEKPADSPKVKGITLQVSVEADARKQLVEAVWRRTEANCPVLLLIRETTPFTAKLETRTQ